MDKDSYLKGINFIGLGAIAVIFGNSFFAIKSCISEANNAEAQKRELEAHSQVEISTVVLEEDPTSPSNKNPIKYTFAQNEEEENTVGVYVKFNEEQGESLGRLAGQCNRSKLQGRIKNWKHITTIPPKRFSEILHK